MIKIRVTIIILLSTFNLFSQTKDTVKKSMPEYYRKEEIIVDGKRYRLHNNYLTLGPGFLTTNLRSQSQRAISIDFQFHIRRQQFQIGALMSGPNFSSNNDAQVHFGYGYRRETKTSNVAVFIGPNYYTGVLTRTDSAGEIFPEFYEGVGGYLCIQGVKKFAYDFGLGGELFAELSARRRVIGFKIIAYFSGAYRGPKRNYNPNVRAEYSK